MTRVAFIAYLLLMGITNLAAQPVQPYSADYSLLFNGEHVGDARFSLQLTADSQYSFEAYTIPAGKMAAGNAKHEVLEASSGKLQDNMAAPDHYYTAVKTAEGTVLLEFFYDWKTMTLTRKDDSGQQKSGLKLHSQDRLSYLLSAMQLAANHRNSIIVPLLTSVGIEQISIRKKNRRHINTIAGRVLAQELELGTGKQKPDRNLWLSVDHGFLPVLLEQKTADGIIRMELMRIL